MGPSSSCGRDRALVLIGFGAALRRSEIVGLDASCFSGHSLRAGFATSAAAYGITGENIARQTRHKSTAMVQRYVRDAELFKNNPLKRMGGAEK